MIKTFNLLKFLFLILSTFIFQEKIFSESIDTASFSFETVLGSREIAKKPGTLLYESGKFNLLNKYNTVSVTGLNLELPEGTKEVTWTVEFTGLGAGQSGLLLYDPPTLGTSYDDFWEKVDEVWELKSIEENANFAARLAGVPDGANNEEIVYENAKTSLGKTYLSGQEVGDTVVLNGTNSNLTGIQFEYYASLSPLGGTPEGKIRIYLNDGESVNIEGVSVDPRGDFELSSKEIIVYDNPRGEKGDIYYFEGEVGDSFSIENEHRQVKKIQFEYFAALNPFEKNQMGVLRVYSNDGIILEGSNIPKTLLYKSEPFALRNGYNMVTISDISIELPEDIKNATWTVEFSGLGLISKAGLLTNNKTKIGKRLSGWSNITTGNNANWQLEKTDEVLGGFCIRIAAKVPSFPSITTERKKYIEGESIKVSFANGPQNPKDWVGLYGVEMIPESVAAPAWAYVNGSKVPGEGVANGNIVFSDPLPIGEYFARFLENDGFGELASYSFKVVPPAVVGPAKLDFVEREKVVVDFDYGPGNASDWIAIYYPETDPSKLPSLSWAYVGGSRTVGAPLEKGSVFLSDNLAAGNYVIRFFENDSYKQLAESSLVIKSSSTSPELNIQRMENGEIVIQFEGKLESASKLNGPWSVINGAIEIILPASASKQFFRAVN